MSNKKRIQKKEATNKNTFILAQLRMALKTVEALVDKKRLSYLEVENYQLRSEVARLTKRNAGFPSGVFISGQSEPENLSRWNGKPWNEEVKTLSDEKVEVLYSNIRKAFRSDEAHPG